MEGYRHLSVLVSAKTYDTLRETGYKLGKPISEIVRSGIALVLKSKDCECSGDMRNAGK